MEDFLCDWRQLYSHLTAANAPTHGQESTISVSQLCLRRIHQRIFDEQDKWLLNAINNGCDDQLWSIGVRTLFSIPDRLALFHQQPNVLNNNLTKRLISTKQWNQLASDSMRFYSALACRWLSCGAYSDLTAQRHAELLVKFLRIMPADKALSTQLYRIISSEPADSSRLMLLINAFNHSLLTQFDREKLFSCLLEQAVECIKIRDSLFDDAASIQSAFYGSQQAVMSTARSLVDKLLVSSNTTVAVNVFMDFSRRCLLLQRGNVGNAEFIKRHLIIRILLELQQQQQQPQLDIYRSVFMRVLEAWAEPLFARMNRSVGNHQLIAFTLCCLMRYFNTFTTETASAAASEYMSIFMRGVGWYLECEQPSIRQMQLTVAEILSDYLCPLPDGAKLRFDLPADGSDEFCRFFKRLFDDSVVDNCRDENIITPPSPPKSPTQGDGDDDQPENEFSDSSIPNSLGSLTDSDDETLVDSQDEDDNTVNGSSSQRPRSANYLREAIEYIRRGVDTQQPQLILAGLRPLDRLIRLQSFSHSPPFHSRSSYLMAPSPLQHEATALGRQNLSEQSEELFELLLRLQDSFELSSRFEEFRSMAAVALLEEVHDRVPLCLVRLVFECRQLSLGQRLQAMDWLVRAVQSFNAVSVGLHDRRGRLISSARRQLLDTFFPSSSTISSPINSNSAGNDNGLLLLRPVHTRRFHSIRPAVESINYFLPDSLHRHLTPYFRLLCRSLHNASSALQSEPLFVSRCIDTLTMLLHCAGTSHPGYESELIPEYRDVLEWTWTRYVSNSGDKLSPVLSSSILFQQWMLGFDILRHSALVHNLWQMQEWWRSIIDNESSAPHCKEIAGRLLHIIKIDY